MKRIRRRMEVDVWALSGSEVENEHQSGTGRVYCAFSNPIRWGKMLNDKFNKKDFNVFSALIHLEDVLTLFIPALISRGSRNGEATGCR